MPDGSGPSPLPPRHSPSPLRPGPGGAGTRGQPLAGQAPRLARPPSALGVSGLRAALGCGGASGGGGFARARKPGAAQESWLGLRAFPPELAGGAIPGRQRAVGTMGPLLCALAALALLRAAGTNAADPSRGDAARSTGCDTHVAVLGRLDVIEEMVEKTVEHLEAEVKGLLSQLEGLAWNLPPGTFSLTPDLLGDGALSRKTGVLLTWQWRDCTCSLLEPCIPHHSSQDLKAGQGAFSTPHSEPPFLPDH